MSDLSGVEKRGFERLFGMGSGYVLDFSNRTFEEFILDITGKCIYDSKYENASGSKANRLRAFWGLEPNYTTAKLLGELLQYAVALGVKSGDEQLLESCQRAVQRLSQSASVTEIDAITPNTADKDFAILAKSIKDAIDKNTPETGIDRLHTFVIKYMRALCQKHGIPTDKDKPLHSLVGEYVKQLKEKGYIESEMTERILKSSISTLEAFNRVRNNQSFAHDNQVLNYDESLFIFNHISSAIRFIEALEKRISLTEKRNSSLAEHDDEIPF